MAMETPIYVPGSRVGGVGGTQYTHLSKIWSQKSPELWNLARWFFVKFQGTLPACAAIWDLVVGELRKIYWKIWENMTVNVLPTLKTLDFFVYYVYEQEQQTQL